jgi:DNA-3-methyladenine glycosylase
MSNRLSRDFFNRNTIDVAKDLIGKTLVYGIKHGIITETEAYRSIDDAACHASRGKTPRTEVMFGQPGVSYVYFIYGMYHCLNIVTEPEGFAAAVLIRGLLIDDTHQNGPGKLCRYLQIDKRHNAIDMINSSELFILDTVNQFEISVTPRIGISVATELPWRFVAKL